MRILCSDGVIELGETGVIAARPVEEVLVSDLRVIKLERRRMAVLGALRSPLRLGGTAHVFDLVQGLLDVRYEVRAGRDPLTPQRVSSIDCKHWLRAHILTPEQELQQP